MDTVAETELNALLVLAESRIKSLEKMLADVAESRLQRHVRILQTNLNRLVEATENCEKFGKLITEEEALTAAQMALVLTGFKDDLPTHSK